MLGGRAQAILGGFGNISGELIDKNGEDPTVVPVDQLGVPTYDELVLVAQRSRVEDDPDVIRLFLSALANGTRAAIANPEAATESILKAGKGLDPQLTRAEVDATLPLLAPAPGQSFGQMDGAKWELFAMDGRPRPDLGRARSNRGTHQRAVAASATGLGGEGDPGARRSGGPPFAAADCQTASANAPANPLRHTGRSTPRPPRPWLGDGGRRGSRPA